MKSIILIAVSTLALVIGFQNCQRGSTSSNNTKVSGSGIPRVERTDLANLERIIFNKIISDPVTFSITYDLRISSASSIGVLFKDNDPQSCILNNSLMSELRDILNSSKLCKAVYSGANMNEPACTEHFIIPRFSLVMNNTSIPLDGLSTSYCKTVGYDLCDDRQSLLEGWFVHVANTIEQNCTPNNLVAPTN